MEKCGIISPELGRKRDFCSFVSLSLAFIMMAALCIVPATAESFSGTAGVIPATDDVYLTVANDEGVYFNDFGNNTFHILWTGGGLNSLHISNGSGTSYGEVTATTDQSGAFYVTTTGGRGYQDDIFLCVAVNGTIPDDFRLHLMVDGYQWTPNPTPHSKPASDAIAYEAATLDEWFTKDDLIYGPQTWRPAAKTTYPLYLGQNVSDTSDQFRLMFVDLDGGVLTAHPLRVRYEIENLTTMATFNVYGYAQNANSVNDCVNSWTNCLSGSGDENSGWYVLGTPLPDAVTVTVTPGSADVPVNGKQQFTATAYGSDGGEIRGTPITWSSSDETVGTIDSDGLFTPVSGGSTIITATAESGASQTATVSVTAAVEKVLTEILLDSDGVIMYADQIGSRTFTATGYDQFGDEVTPLSFTWSSSNEQVGTIDDTGVFTGLAEGATTITAANGSVSETATVEIKQHPDWNVNLIGHIDRTLNRTDIIGLSPGGLMLYTDTRGIVWEGVNLTAVLGLVDDDDLSTFNTTLANLDYNITLTGKAASNDKTVLITSRELIDTDKTFIAAYKMNGYEIPETAIDGRTYWPLKLTGSAIASYGRNIEEITSIAIEFPPDIQRIDITSDSAITFAGGLPIKFTATAYDSSDLVVEQIPFTWSVSDSTIGTIDSDGLFTPLQSGTVTVTAAYREVSESVTVTVMENTSTPITWYVDQSGNGDFMTIQAAIDYGARNGDTIVVRDGIYSEKVTIDKGIILLSENGYNSTVIDDSTRLEFAVTVTADNVRISGFNISGYPSASNSYLGGLELSGVNNCVISGNLFPTVRSIKCSSLYDSTIENNNFISNGYLALSSVTNVVISKNKFASNGANKPLIDLYGSGSGITISDNDIIGTGTCPTGIGFAGVYDSVTIFNNTITGVKKGLFASSLETANIKSVRFLNNAVQSTTSAAVYFINPGTDIEIAGNQLGCGSSYALYMSSLAGNISVHHNEISSSTGKYVTGLKDCGDYLNLYANNISISSSNTGGFLRYTLPTLSSTEPYTYEYNGKTFTNFIGNQYNTYSGIDADGDGLGDTPFNEDGVYDSYPLVSPITGYQILESAPKVIVAPASATLDVDESMNFTVNVYDADGVLMSGAVPVWSSSNTTVGSVDAATGFFEALSAGTTTVTATAEGVTGLAHVTVTLPDLPVANFTAMPLSGDAPLYVQFTDTSTGSITSRSWDFDNDGVIDSTEQNATHTYTAAGNYTVNLTVTNAGGSNSCVKTDYITVGSGGSGGDAPVANFTATPTSGDAPLNVTFTDLSTNAPTSWLWDFGDNETSAVQNATHTYTAAGNYSVSLTVTNPAGNGSAVKADYITVTAPVTLPDLTVSTLASNNGEVFSLSENTYTAKVTNIGEAAAGAFAVGFNVSGDTGSVAVPGGLAAGANTTVTWTDETVRDADVNVTVTATADVDNVITESNEDNNVKTLEKTVVDNGYRGKRWTGGSDIETVATYDVRGDLLYSSGDSAYLSATSYPHWTTYAVNWTTTDLAVPTNATIAAARLYVPYTWDKGPVFPDNVTLAFNDVAVEKTAHYEDEKMWGSSYPYGTSVYDVTGQFGADGNVALLTSTYPGGGNVSVRGMLLAVVYDDGTTTPHTVLINEGFDLLYGGAGQGTTPEQATAYAPFAAVESGAVGARLVTVAPGAGPSEGELIFNDETWTNVWNYTGTSQIGVDERNVTSYLAGSNLAAFQSSADYMEAAAAFLVVEYPLPTGSISVTSTPAGAVIYLDGTDTGLLAPAVLDDVPAGDHVITLKLDDYADASTTVAVQSGETATVDLALTTLTGSLNVTSTPAGAAIFVDGADTGATTDATLADLAVGDHTVTLTKDGYRDAAANVTVRSDETATLHLDLVEAVGSIAVASSPVGAAIFLDGAATGQTTNTTLENVQAGEHIITVTKDGYMDATATVTVVDNETATVTLVLTEPTGSIAVTSSPDGAAIFLDGVDTGEVTNTTLTRVSPGDHTVTLTLDGYADAAATVTVAEDQTATIHLDLESAVITLHPGWNFVSTPKRLADGQNTIAIFDEVDTADHSVLLYNGSQSWEAMSSQEAFEPLDGIWIYANGTYTIPLHFAAGSVQAPPTKDLDEGWNAIGFSDTVPATAADTLLSVDDAWTTLFAFDAGEQAYGISIINDATGRHGDDRLMDPMQGYWLYMNVPDTLAAIGA